MSRLDQRLDRIERALAPDVRPYVYCWQEGDETEAEAWARYFRDHPEKRGAHTILIRWVCPGEAA